VGVGVARDKRLTDPKFGNILAPFRDENDDVDSIRATP
jgi:hypothetical protein